MLVPPSSNHRLPPSAKLRHSPGMTVLALCLAIALGLLASERGLERLPFAAAALATVACALLLVLGDLERALFVTGLLATAIGGFSRVKHHHSGIKLRVADIALLFAGTLPFLVAQYRRAALAVIASGTALICVAIALLMTVDGLQTSFDQRIAIFALAATATAIAYRAGGGAEGFRRIENDGHAYVSTFLASLIDVASWWPSRSLAMIDVAPAGEQLPLAPAIPARRQIKPDILVIQHESVFDPRLYGLPIQPQIVQFLSPPGGISGTLNVDIFGGGSWQSEFSLLTGLSSASFGPDAYFIFRKGAGRFHHALPHSLRALGYRTTLVSSCRRSFLNYAHFYRSIGIDEMLFAGDDALPLDVDEFERSHADSMFFDALGKVVARRPAHDDQPLFHYALTNFNHGPHDCRRVAPHRFEPERTFAQMTCPDPLYAEYYARLAETAASWCRLKSQLAARAKRRPMLIVHYGDHQPVLARRLERALGLADDARRPFRTFYALEALNFELDRAAIPASRVLDLAFLGTVAQVAAGLPLDRVSATRAGLIEPCADGYFLADSADKQRFHRTLVNLGLIDLEPRRPDGTLTGRPALSPPWNPDLDYERRVRR